MTMEEEESNSCSLVHRPSNRYNASFLLLSLSFCREEEEEEAVATMP